MSNPRVPLIYAHRGASADHPENTSAAFAAAVEQGADAVELDVRLSSEGDLVVHHDAHFPGGSTVYSTPRDERPEHCVELDAALEACGTLLVNVEIKNSPGDLGAPEVPHDLTVVDRVLALLAERRDRGSRDRIVISSFDWSTLERTRSLGGWPTALLTMDVHGDAIERAAAAGDVAANVWDPMVDADLVQRCHRLGLELNVWTVDDPTRLVELAALGVDGLITNVPALARQALG